jgi:putative spermidine/putrescine transport system substrate-binding protein
MLLRKNKTIISLGLISTLVLSTSLLGCGKKATTDNTTTKTTDFTSPAKADVTKEGALVSYGMPDEWANYGEIFTNIKTQFGITHQDTDMTSAEELAKFKAEKDKPVSDIGDVGITFGNVAKTQGLVQPYKTKYWSEIPDWAKDPDGYWTAAYTGSIVLLVNKKMVTKVPTSWADLLDPSYKGKIVTGDMLKAAQSQNALLAAAFANGGDEKNITPGIEYFAKLQKAGNLKPIDNRIADFQKGEIAVGMLWDFNALSYKEKMPNPDDYVVVVPSDGTVMSAYVALINKWAPHPNAAKAFQDYLFSDEGQVLLAKGFTRPIRKVTLPADIASKLIPDAQYTSAKQIKDYSAWEETVKGIPDLWRDKVLAQ